MKDTKILTIQDISCVGQCSLTVALPIISACGIETAVLPSAVLSTHTAGFKGFTFRDLTPDMPGITEHWLKEGISFEAVYTGYLGSEEQITYVIDIMNRCTSGSALKIVDPAMADGGKLYPIFDMAYVESMKKLCAIADIVVPNITEAALLVGFEYKEDYDEAYIKGMCEALCRLGSKSVVLTGVGYREGFTGVAVYSNGKLEYYEHEKIAKGCHGTGDVYASAFVGALMRGRSMADSARIAADYVVECIKYTKQFDDHWYGVKFEAMLPSLIDAVAAK